jgi:xanthine dehydrogenase YagS FAD-binding subunit
MKSFDWVQPATVADAITALEHPGSMPLAGGVDLLDRMKERLDTPSRLVSLRKLPGFDAIAVEGGVATIGAAVTLAQLASDPKLRASHAIIGDAAGHAATPQLRAMATLGGNLAQRPRCWYFRSELFACRKKGGSTCFALAGDNEMHAIYGNRTCAATHPSTIATALVALGARVTIAGRGGKTREVELAKLFVAPETDVAREVDLQPGELITGVTVPAAPANLRTAYIKQVAKQSFDWPILDVAVALAIDGSTCRKATIVLGAVAPVPLRATAAERLLEGKAINEGSARAAAAAMAATATPLAHNRFKVQVLEAVIARTIVAAATRRAP